MPAPLLLPRTTLQEVALMRVLRALTLPAVPCPIIIIIINITQDEMKALQRLNTAYFLIGYLGFLVTWVRGLGVLPVLVSAAASRRPISLCWHVLMQANHALCWLICRARKGTGGIGKPSVDAQRPSCC